MVTQSTQQLRKPLGLNGEMFRRALFDSFVKLNPKSMARNPGYVCRGSGKCAYVRIMDSSTVRHRRSACMVYRFRITLAMVHGSLRKLF